MTTSPREGQTDDELLHEFIQLFNEERFFEAHEALEFLWRREKGISRDFYHGLIQVAAAFVHLKKNHPSGAETLLQKAKGYLRKYPTQYHGIPLKKLLENAQNCLRARTGFPTIALKSGKSRIDRGKKTG